MANLVTVTRVGRLFLKIGGLIFGVLFIVYIFVQGGSLVRDLFFPKPPPPPAQAFGKLPSVNLPLSETANITYTINTVNGELPSLPSRINVYKIISIKPSLLALDEAKSRLESADFVDNQTKLTDTLYRWTQTGSGVIIEYDILTNNFEITSNYLTNPRLISTTLLPGEVTIKSDVEGFLRRIQAKTQNLDMENMTIEYLEIQNGQLTKAQNLGTARLARVNIPHQSIDDIGFVYGNEEGSLVSFLVSYPGSRIQILQGVYYNYEIDTEQSSDYPVKSVLQAYEDLQKGQAYVINPQNLLNVNITNVELKYYLNKENYGYLLPVFVFTGVNFKGIVEALPSTSIAGQTEEVQNPPSQ